MASTLSPIGHNLTSNSNHIKATKTPHLTLLSHNYASTAMLYMCKDGRLVKITVCCVERPLGVTLSRAGSLASSCYPATLGQPVWRRQPFATRIAVPPFFDMDSIQQLWDSNQQPVCTKARISYSYKCTAYIVQCTVCSVQCKVYSVQCTAYSVQCTSLYSVQCLYVGSLRNH